jgi:hypothetical protein
VLVLVLSEAVLVIETDAKNCIHEFEYEHDLPFMIAHPQLEFILEPDHAEVSSFFASQHV